VKRAPWAPCGADLGASLLWSSRSSAWHKGGGKGGVGGAKGRVGVLVAGAGFAGLPVGHRFAAAMGACGRRSATGTVCACRLGGVVLDSATL
jgi:hypothetical protein